MSNLLKLPLANWANEPTSWTPIIAKKIMFIVNFLSKFYQTYVALKFVCISLFLG